MFMHRLGRYVGATMGLGEERPMPFAPEFVSESRREVVLVSNHSLANDEAVLRSIAFNLGRVQHGRAHLPGPEPWTLRLIYDIRGQDVSTTVVEEIASALGSAAQIEFKR